MAALNHPNIVAVHDIGIEDGVLYMVAELVDGERWVGPSSTCIGRYAAPIMHPT